ncbi:MAG: TonB-dependent receptor plug domain-containing protein [Bryobacteraceae bacterium]
MTNRGINLGFVILAIAAMARCQDPRDMPTYVVDVVTDTKIPQQQKNVTQKVMVLDSADFSQVTTANRNIAELLLYQPGVAVTVLSRNDANWGSYGGLGPKYNAYLLDGLPIDGFVDTMSLDAWAFERIETHQGPASVLYGNYLSMDFAGNQAPLAGITNLVLKDRIDRPMTRVLAGGGSWNALNVRFYHQDRKGRLHYFFGVGHDQSDYTDYGTAGSWLNILQDPSYKKTKLYGKATCFLGREEHKISFFAQHTIHDGFAGRPNRDYGHGYTTLNAVYSNQVNSRLTVQAKAGFRNYDRRWGEDNYPNNLLLREHAGVGQRVFPADLTFNLRHSGESVFTVGADSQYATYLTYSEAKGPRAPGNDASALSAGLFFQEKYVAGNWVLRAGARAVRAGSSYNLLDGAIPGLRERSWNRMLWSGGARYNFSKRFALYANLGSSFLPPAAKSVGGTLSAADRGIPGRNGQLPNPGLRPESGLGSDFGADFRPAERAILGVRLFYNRVNDAIVENVVSNTPSQSMSVNAGRARSHGFEIPYQQDLTDRVQVFANLTRTFTRVSSPLDADQSGAAIPFVPDYAANAGFSLRMPREFTVSPYLHAVGTYFDSTSKSGRGRFGPYRILNLKLEKTLSRTDAYSTVLFTDLNNLTNRKFEMPWQFRDPGFNIFGGLEFRF